MASAWWMWRLGSRKGLLVLMLMLMIMELFRELEVCSFPERDGGMSREGQEGSGWLCRREGGFEEI